MKKNIKAILSHPGVSFFLFFLGLSVIVGDGKQPIADAYIGLGLVIFVLVRVLWGAPKALPRKTVLLWAILLVYILVRCFFSVEVGYSLSGISRYIEAFLIFFWFYNWSASEVVFFSSSAGWVGAFFIVLSFVSPLIFPKCNLSLMSLVCSSYGHNHIADIALLLLPWVFTQYVGRSSRLHAFLFFLYGAGVLYSFSRGALVIFLLYVAWKIIGGHLDIYKKRVPFFLLLLCVISLLLFTGLAGFSSWGGTSGPVASWAQKYMKKSTFEAEKRIVYWSQALIAWRENPVFGYGLGTFNLQSRLLQDHTRVYSWFAHNMILQDLVEIGLVGVVLLGGLIWFSAAPKKDQDLLSNAGLFHSVVKESVVIGFAYGLIEFNFDFLIIWLLWWGFLGLLARPSFDTHGLSKKTPTFLIVICFMVFLVLLSLSSIGGYMFSFLGYASKAFYMAPYNADISLYYMRDVRNKKKELSPYDTRLILFFHRTNPDVLFQLAVAPGNRENGAFYKEAKLGDPQNTQYLDGYVRYQLSHNGWQQAWNTLYIQSRRMLPIKYFQQIDDVNAGVRGLNGISFTEMPLVLSTQPENYLSEVYYFFGSRIASKDPESAERLWRLASDVSPQWSFFSIEAASMAYHTLHRASEAYSILSNCINEASSRSHCSTFSLASLPPPGSLYQKIIDISR